MSSAIIPVFYAISDDFAPYAAVSIKSLAINADPNDQYQIIILHQGLSDTTKATLSGLSTANVTVTFTELKQSLSAIQDQQQNFLRADFFTLTIFYRLFIADMFPQFDKAIYIDSDTVIPGNLAKLYQISLGDNLIGAAPDHSIEHVPPMVHYITGALGIPATEYINSGVLLLNLTKLRDEHFSHRFLSLLTKYQFDCIAPDQDYLNTMCHGRIHYLDEVWDAMPKEPDYAPVANPQLVHYNLFYKPWYFDHIMYGDYFWQYADQTPYRDELHRQLNTYTKAQQDADRAKLTTLMNKAGRLPDTPTTFKKVAAQGEAIYG
ncbi:MAG TPA: glycosyltransferase family 8 protein [Lactobacillus sp.]|nr:glycosyltransferase family 8 protein [Lactobacillus sp.]